MLRRVQPEPGDTHPKPEFGYLPELLPHVRVVHIKVGHTAPKYGFVEISADGRIMISSPHRRKIVIIKIMEVFLLADFR
jgi:hypothetical protein